MRKGRRVRQDAVVVKLDSFIRQIKEEALFARRLAQPVNSTLPALIPGYRKVG